MRWNWLAVKPEPACLGLSDDGDGGLTRHHTSARPGARARPSVGQWARHGPQSRRKSELLQTLRSTPQGASGQGRWAVGAGGWWAAATTSPTSRFPQMNRSVSPLCSEPASTRPEHGSPSFLTGQAARLRASTRVHEYTSTRVHKHTKELREPVPQTAADTACRLRACNCPPAARKGTPHFAVRMAIEPCWPRLPLGLPDVQCQASESSLSRHDTASKPRRWALSRPACASAKEPRQCRCPDSPACRVRRQVKHPEERVGAWMAGHTPPRGGSLGTASGRSCSGRWG